jgi:hypothetical protein
VAALEHFAFLLTDIAAKFPCDGAGAQAAAHTDAAADAPAVDRHASLG